ncbi:hypothetical protein MBM09_08485 [Flaviramulus sp. BrNp1-15]|uniref:hypothetical protein n=1 Tax=Flaviramulus sp. BrNp1-15 TaxID=2916754 RepID=UPI001EE8C93B|nr:hypothetical protein [Flaviramulus sp. BrNp1-15]ULC57955.1 hypothetical protein MBM09_08485 [Flaviramulus sp. BrNp1-15]
MKSFFFASDGFENENKSRIIKYIGTKKKTKRLDCEKRMLLDKYNTQLNRHLKTLNYLSVIEADSKFNKNKTQIAEILNIKAQVQKDVIEITSKINQFKLKYKIASSI